MIKISKEDLAQIRPVGNWVLIKPNRGNDEYLMANGHKLFLDISFERERHAPVVGTVVATPERLDKKFLEWDVDMELQVGDIAFYSYLSAMRALDANESNHERRNPMMLLCEGEPYFWIDYTEISVVRRTCTFKSVGGTKPSSPVVKDFILPINGICLVEPVQEHNELRLGKLLLEQTQMAKRHSHRYGKVAHVSGALIRKYNDGDGVPDQDLVKPGDYICFDRACDIPVEYDLHASLESKKTFFKIQRRYISAIIPAELVKDMQ